MQHTEGNFKGVRDANIYYQAWLPEGEGCLRRCCWSSTGWASTAGAI